MKLSEFIEKYGDCEVNVELMDMVEKVDDKGDWKPELGESYYLISEDLQVSEAKHKGDDYAYARIMKRNVYRTEKEAKKALEMYEFCKTRSFEPDWEDEKQIKYSLFLEYIYKTADFNGTSNLKRFAPFYYPTKEAVEEIISKYSFEELEKYYGRV